MLTRRQIFHSVASIVSGKIVSHIGIQPALSYAAQPNAANDTVTFALIGPITGTLAPLGEFMKGAARVALELINDQGGILGRKLILEIVDDRGDPLQAKNAAIWITSHAPRIPVVIGHATSATAIAATEVYIDSGTLLFSAVNDDSFNPMGNPLITRTIPTAKHYAPHVCDEIINSGRTTIGIVHNKASVDVSFVKNLTTGLAEKGLVPFLIEGIEVGDKDFSALISKLKSFRINALAFAARPQIAGLIARQSMEQDYIVPSKGHKNNPQIFGWSTLMSPEFSSIAGMAGDGAKVVSFHGSDPDELHKDMERYPNLRKIFERNNANPYEVYTLMILSAFQIAAQAINQAGTLDTTVVGRILNEMTFDTIRGQKKFNPHGDLEKPEEDLELFEIRYPVGAKFIKSYAPTR